VERKRFNANIHFQHALSVVKLCNFSYIFSLVMITHNQSQPLNDTTRNVKVSTKVFLVKLPNLKVD
jgi:hypothetical protein